MIRVLRSHSLVKCELTPARLTYHYKSMFLRCKEKLLVGVEKREGPWTKKTGTRMDNSASFQF